MFQLFTRDKSQSPSSNVYSELPKSLERKASSSLSPSVQDDELEATGGSAERKGLWKSYSVRLLKDPSKGFGIRISTVKRKEEEGEREGGEEEGEREEEEEEEERSIVIKSIIPEGPAYVDGRLTVGE